jgi:Flp pilus assembly protein TadG
MGLIRAIRKLVRDRRGAGSVEFVIGLPLILIGQSMAFDFGRVLMDQHALESGVRDATRYLARSNITACPTSGDFQYGVYNRLVVSGLQSEITASDINCTFTTSYNGNTTFRRSFVVVEVNAEVEIETPLLSSFFGSITVAALDRARHIGD